MFHERILLAVGDYLVVQDTLQPADVIHVIAGDDYRTEHAIHLYQQGYAKTLFFTGGWCEYHQYYHGQHGKELALAAGIPEQAVAYDDSPVTSTYAEAELLNLWLDEHPQVARSVIVVSDPFHMRRVQWTFHQVMSAQIKIMVSPVSYELISFQRLWWKDTKSRIIVAREYLKIFYYLFRYKYSPGFVRGWLSAFDKY
jgi:uncharacterized SAM-binding protein YcdF (DUF218 family)